MNKEKFNMITEYFLQGKITITTYSMLIQTIERMHDLNKARQELENEIEKELERMQQGEFNHFYYNAHFITK